ncbi:FecR domain-containing protein [Chitinophaga nivalis]|uniref:FecR domain-containing protein n=1 Tax=Chitinophaga nivalis TaxID=2991709 RepID=A0ABT3IMA3_9BACT|nr:FecR domain-containing protein [Chitinophaga nivalis]MCW3465240.1 FecR domain-containing protein [Chitinophaga nivalis]MCW3485068.1 FecR domain-containing protein [Chitinophaga nivalis]
MSTLSHNQEDFELLGKYLSGEASPEEAITVDDWLAADPANRLLFDQISTIWYEVVQHRHILPDKEKVLLEIQRHFPQLTIQRRPIAKPNRYWWGVAAGMLLLIGAATFFFLVKTHQPDTTYISLNAKAGVLRDTLPDQSLVVVNSYGGISYPADFNHKERSLHLTGEAWFDVTASATKPFIVRAGAIAVKVLGTSFNVKESKDGVEVTVKTGAVLMYRGSRQLTVKAGQRGVYQAASEQFSLIQRFDINPIGYATRVFNFENATLKEIIIQLEKAYGIHVVLENEKLNSCTMSSLFENKSVRYIFDVISITLNVECRFENNTVYITGAGCS